MWSGGHSFKICPKDHLFLLAGIINHFQLNCMFTANLAFLWVGIIFHNGCPGKLAGALFERISMLRFTWLTNAFSKRIENLGAAVSLHFMYYNFCRIHQSLRTTSPMATGISGHLREISEIIDLLVGQTTPLHQRVFTPTISPGRSFISEGTRTRNGRPHCGRFGVLHSRIGICSTTGPT